MNQFVIGRHSGLHAPHSRIVAAILLFAAGCGPQLKPQQRALLDEARAAYDQQRYPVAISKLDAFLGQVKDHPAAGDAYYLRGLSQARSGQRASAYADLRSCVTVSDDSETVWRAYMLLGTMYFEDERWDDGLQALRAAAERMPDRAPKDTVLARLAMCFERTGRWVEARERYAQIAQRYPSGPYGDWARRRQLLKPDHFAVQCGAFSQSRNADTLVAGLKSRGFPAQVRSEPRERGTMQVVLLGRYASYEEARSALESLRVSASDLVRDPVIWP
jgi:tetratricopeptide (TPR) repeat protein